MSITRRRFVKAGLLAAAFAALPLRSIVGQSFKERDGDPIETPPVQGDVLSNYSRETFRTLLDSIFQLHTTTGIVEVTLLSVEDLPAPKGGECFALLFRGGSRPQPQDTYTLVHSSLGTFQLLLVPGGANENGAQSYVATLNRLSMVDLVNLKAPTRVHSTGASGQRNTYTNTNTNTTNTTTTTTNTVTTSPTITTTSTGVGPVVTHVNTSAPTSKRKRRRKPARKRMDDLKQLL